MKNNRQYPIGKIFHENFFAALLYFNYDELQSSFKKLKLNLIRKLELISYIDRKFRYTKEAIRILKLDPNAVLQPKERCDINCVLDALGDQISDYDDGKGNLAIEMVQETITQVFTPTIKPLENNIRVIFWIAQGLFNKRQAYYDNLKSQGAEAFEISVQGHFNATLLKSALSFNNVSEELSQTIEDWIDNKEKIPEEDHEEALRRFLIMVTGAPAVPHDRKITFYRNSEAQEITVSACYYIISLPNENTSDAWNKFLQLLALPSFYDVIGYGRA